MAMGKARTPVHSLDVSSPPKRTAQPRYEPITSPQLSSKKLKSLGMKKSFAFLFEREGDEEVPRGVSFDDR